MLKKTKNYQIERLAFAKETLLLHAESKQYPDIAVQSERRDVFFEVSAKNRILWQKEKPMVHFNREPAALNKSIQPYYEKLQGVIKYLKLFRGQLRKQAIIQLESKINESLTMAIDAKSQGQLLREALKTWVKHNQHCGGVQDLFSDQLLTLVLIMSDKLRSKEASSSQRKENFKS